MIIDRDFSLYGFERKGYEQDGCVFLKWEHPKDEKFEPKIREDNYYGGYYDRTFYRIEIPKQKDKILSGVVMVVRNSKNRYNISMYDGKGVQFGFAASLTDIRKSVEEFFKEAKR